jgi:hypothetical protein
MADDRAMPGVIYYRRQAQNCLELARNTHDPAMNRRLAMLANEFVGKAAACEEEAFISAALAGHCTPMPAQ